MEKLKRLILAGEQKSPEKAPSNTETSKFTLNNNIVISCGPTHALARGSSDSLYGWGSNQYGQLGDDSTRDVIPQPESINVVGNMHYYTLQVSCGIKHSAVLAYPYDEKEKTEKATIFTFGCPDNGRLGRPLLQKELADGEESEEDEHVGYRPRNLDVTNPVMVFENKPIKMVSCGSSFTLALSLSGQLYSWGDGSSGALGTGFYDDVWEPKLIKFDSKKDEIPPIRFIAAGYAHAVAVTETGQMYSWGSGEMGQLSHETLQNTTVPTEAVIPRVKILMASCGMYHTMVVTEDQMLLGCGANKNGQLGFSDLANRDKLEEVTFFVNQQVSWVACGANHTLVVTHIRKVFAFGNNNHFKCGIVNPQEVGKNITIPSEICFPLAENDEVYQVAASMNLSMAISKGGEIFTWGKNHGGLLGREIQHMKSPTIAFNDDGGVTKVLEHQQAPDADLFEDLGPGSVGDLFIKNDGDGWESENLSIAIKDLRCGIAHTVALTNAGELYVWGSNEYGQHAITSSELQKIYQEKQSEVTSKILDLPSECLPSLVMQFNIRQGKKITHIATGYFHVIAVENFRKVYSWGKNSEGQLGLGFSSKVVIEPSPVPEVSGHLIKEIAASESHSLILTEFGELFSFGSPLYGRLGLGVSSALQLTPRRIKGIPPVDKIRCGPTHSMALVIEKILSDEEDGKEKDDTVLYTWGSGWGGKLGHGNLDNFFVPTRVDTSVRFKEIACGFCHSAGISNKGKLYVWGPREYFGLVEMKVSEVLGSYQAKLSDLYLLKPTLFEHHIFGNFSFNRIALGNHYSLALSENNVLYKWGNFDNIMAEEFKKIDDHLHLKKELAELIRIEKHSNLLKNTFTSLPGMQDYIIRLDCSVNHAIAFSQRYAYSWGLDSFTGRLGHTGDLINAEPVDKEEAKEQESVQTGDQQKKIDHPKIIKFLSNIFNRNTQRLNTQRKIEPNNDAMSGKTKKSGRSKKSAESRANQNKSRNSARGSNSAKITASMTSLMDIEDDNMARGGKNHKNFAFMLKDSMKTNRYKNVMLNTDRLEKKIQSIYRMYHDLKVSSNKISTFSKSTENMIVTRLLSEPFNITPSTKHFMKLPLEFVENKESYRRLYTLLQLHPCYLRNIYRERKIPTNKFYKIIKEIFGDMEEDKRKTRLFIAVCIEILKEELKNKDAYSLNFDSLHDEVHSTPLFTRLFRLLMKSNPQNMEYLSLVGEKLKQATDSAMQHVTNKFLKQFALTFKGKEVNQIMEKYKNENEAFKMAEMERIVKRVRDANDRVVEEISKKVITSSGKSGFTDPRKKALSKDVKFLLKKCVEVTKNCFRNTDIILEQIQNKASVLIFVHLREKLRKNVNTDLERNMNNLADAFLMYIKGGTFPADHEKWVVELNNSILQSDEQRRKLLSTFHCEEYHIDDKHLKGAFYHSTELENDKIQCTLGSIACLTNFLNENASKVAVIKPEKLDFIVKFKETLNPKNNYIIHEPSPQEAKMIVNLKLKTRQLLYGEDNTMKICNTCGVYLKDALVSTDSGPLLKHLSAEDPRSLRTYFKKFLEDLDEGRINLLLKGTEEFDGFAKKSLEYYKGKEEYEKVSNVVTFQKALDEELESQFPWYKERFKSQEINQRKYNILKQLHFQLSKRLDEELVFESNVKFLDELFSSKIIPLGKEVLKWRNDDLANGKAVIDAIKYGTSIQNAKADKILSKNRQSIYSAVRGQLNRKTQSKDLVENLSHEEKKNLLLFGKYTLHILKIKKILASFENPRAVVAGKEKKKVKLEKYSLIFTKVQDKYNISLIYSTKKNNLISLFVKSKKEFEEVIDEFTLTEKYLLRVRHAITKNNENYKTIPLGKFVQVNTLKFFELIDALNSNQGIYEQQITRRQGEQGSEDNKNNNLVS